VSILIVDIETIPIRKLWTVPPKEEWRDGAEPFPPLWATEVVCIGSMLLDNDYTYRKLGLFGETKDEAGMLGDYAAYMNDSRPQLVTWNGRGFDVPVLNYRLMRYGIPLPWYFAKDVRYRYNESGHCDLMDHIMDFGAAGRGRIPLDGVARLLGLPGKTDITGKDVEGLWNGSADDPTAQLAARKKVKEYCLCDVVQTAVIFLRWRLFGGLLPIEKYRAAVEDLLDKVQFTEATTNLVKAIDRDAMLLR
jgi:predicted PolB exonuclease-like 3'-5' exonuclease